MNNTTVLSTLTDVLVNKAEKLDVANKKLLFLERHDIYIWMCEECDEMGMVNGGGEVVYSGGKNAVTCDCGKTWCDDHRWVNSDGTLVSHTDDENDALIACKVCKK